MVASTTSESKPHIRTYDRPESVVFLRTRDEFGGLSNMAGGFNLFVNGLHILTCEALYQACRYPHIPWVQRLILAQSSPMSAKMKSKPYRSDSRDDWDEVRLKIMRWCLRVKLTQHWTKFSDLLLATGNRAIVEESRRDDFWGAKAAGDRKLIGTNALGRLLMELRSEVSEGGTARFTEVAPLAIPNFRLDGELIGSVTRFDVHDASVSALWPGRPAKPRRGGKRSEKTAGQRSLSDWLLPDDDA